MKAYGEMRDRLRRGLISPDDRLVDLQIADELGASRMPVREALLQLVSEGYLVSTARGYRVPTLSLQDVAEIFEVRLPARTAGCVAGGRRHRAGRPRQVGPGRRRRPQGRGGRRLRGSLQCQRRLP